MKKFYYGELFYNYGIGRLDVKYQDGETEGGLHCGQCLDVFINGDWISTRIEMARDWYLAGIKKFCKIDRLKVRL